jgi:hypothetical protein
MGCEHFPGLAPSNGESPGLFEGGENRLDDDLALSLQGLFDRVTSLLALPQQGGSFSYYYMPHASARPLPAPVSGNSQKTSVENSPRFPMPLPLACKGVSNRARTLLFSRIPKPLATTKKPLTG